MAHSVSARKRIRQNAQRRERNRARKSQIKTAVRKVDTAIGAGDKEQSAAALRSASQVVDKIAATGTIHRNKAARMKSRLARRVNAAK